MATGFAKWGMTGGTAAGLLRCDLLLGDDNPSTGLFDPNRLTLRASAMRLVKENAAAGLHFVDDGS
jgi:glycine/D-amino acid oxidase-like deaminating enzyme